MAANWTAHPSSPIFNSKDRSRLGGRPLISDGKITLFLQDNSKRYGSAVVACDIIELSPNTLKISEQTRKVIEGSGNFGWNHDGMHHVDFGPNGRCLVDGHYVVEGRGGHWSVAVVENCQTEDDLRSIFAK